MASDDHVTKFLSRNKTFAQNYTPAPLARDIIAKIESGAKFLAIISCFDSRANPEKYFGLQPGEAVVLSNAGGRVNDDIIRNLIILDKILGLGTVIVMHHTDCGLCNITDETIRMKLKVELPAKVDEIESMKFGEIKDPHDSVRNDVKVLQRSPFVGKDVRVLGFVFDITRGTVEAATTEYDRRLARRSVTSAPKL